MNEASKPTKELTGRIWGMMTVKSERWPKKRPPFGGLFKVGLTTLRYSRLQSLVGAKLALLTI